MAQMRKYDLLGERIMELLKPIRRLPLKVMKYILHSLIIINYLVMLLMLFFLQKPEQQIFASRLRITKVDMFDRGFYDCIASNGIDKIQSQGLLEITNERWGNKLCFNRNSFI